MRVLLKIAVWIGVAIAIWVIAAWSIQLGVVGIILGAFIIGRGLRRGRRRHRDSLMPATTVGDVGM